MNTVKTVALGVFVVLIGTQCFGAVVNQDQAELNRKLFVAAIYDKGEDIDDCLSRGAEIDCVDSTGDTPLMTAIVCNCANVTQKLLGRRANVNAQNNEGDTPLMRAAVKANFALVRVLLERGAQVDAQTISGWTALMIAAQVAGEDQRTNDKYFNTIRVLVEDGKADRSIVNKRGTTALDLARKNRNNDETIFALLTMGG